MAASATSGMWCLMVWKCLRNERRLIALMLDGLEALGLRRFVGKGLKVCDKPAAKVVSIMVAVAR